MELPAITSHPISRFTSQSLNPVADQQIHGFSDASKVAYGGVVYIRRLHSDTSVSVSLLISRTRVAPLSGLSIPRLELCGALLLAKLLHSVVEDLSVPQSEVYTWCDSSAVLGWLNMSLTRLTTLSLTGSPRLSRESPPNSGDSGHPAEPSRSCLLRSNSSRATTV